MASVSILIPTRNRPEFLLEAIASIERQTHPELELIVARDGGAPLGDAVRAAADRLEFPTTWVEHDGEPEGAAVTRNRGLEAARGDAVALLDDDDLWEPDHVAGLARALEDDPDLDVAYSDTRVLLVSSGDTRRLRHDWDPVVFVRDGFIPTSASLIRRSAFARFGAYDPEFTLSEDWEWLIRAARAGARFKRVPAETATVRIHGGGLSSLSSEGLAARRLVLERMAAKYALAPIEPKTFWEVAVSL